MAIKGSLKEAGLADVCQLLSMGQKTGCLSVTDQSRFGQIYFDHGRITFATIVNRRDRLGDLLVREEAITHEQLGEAIDAQATRPDRRLGELLLESGALDADTLTAAIRRQIEDAIYYLFTWKRGNFYFEVGKGPDRGEILIAVNPETLLLEGARRVDEWSIIEKKITSMDLIFGLEEERIREAAVGLTTEQERLVPLIDGVRTVEDLAEATGLDELATARALYGLIQAGFAHRVGRRTDEPAEAVDVREARNLGVAFYQTAMLDSADREFRRVLQHNPHDVSARHYLALVALRQSRLTDAVRWLTGLLEVAGPGVAVYLNLAYALRLQRRFGAALRTLDDARSIAGDEPRILLAQGATHLFAGDRAAALDRFQEFARLVPALGERPATYYYCAGLAEAAEGRLELAEALVEQGLAIHTSSAPLRLLAGVLAEAHGDTSGAERAFRRAAEEDPSLPQAHKNLGDLAYRRGRPAEAMEHYGRALEADPDLGDDVYTRLGDLHYRRDEREDAVRCWRRAVKLNPHSDVARSHLEGVGHAPG